MQYGVVVPYKLRDGINGNPKLAPSQYANQSMYIEMNYGSDADL